MNGIILCEPLCHGFEHSTGNAALLETVFSAYPNDCITFMAEDEHIEWVKTKLRSQKSDCMQQVNWKSISIPPRSISGFKRFKKDLCWFKNLISVAQSTPCKAVLICSITNTTLLILKLWLYRHSPDFHIMAIPHGILSTLSGKKPVNPISRLLSFRKMLSLPHPAQLKYLLLGETIYKSVVEFQPKWANHFTFIDLPYFHEEADVTNIQISESVCFGYFGVTIKGFDAFYNLALEVQGKNDRAAFALVGHLSKNGNQKTYDPCKIIGLTDKPLSSKEYVERSKKLTYAVGITDPEHYRWGANSSFVDALSFVKPGIYLRNSYVEYYFDKMGDVGYICDSYNQIKETVISILDDFPTQRYQEQTQNIINGRKLFEPVNISPKMRTIIDGAFA